LDDIRAAIIAARGVTLSNFLSGLLETDAPAEQPDNLSSLRDSYHLCD